MATGKPLAQFAIYPLAMPAAVALCLWVLLGPLHIGQPKAFRPAATPAPPPALVSTPEAPVEPEITGIPGYSGRLRTPMRDALARKGYGAGLAGEDDGEQARNALSALQAFQDNAGLPVQPTCDRRCQTALGLPKPE